VHPIAVFDFCNTDHTLVQTGWSAAPVPRSLWLKCDTLFTLHMHDKSLFSVYLKKEQQQMTAKNVIPSHEASNEN